MAEIVHRPCGWGHPYAQEPNERVPRHPEVGEIITLYAQCQPQNAFTKVWVVWMDESGEEKKVEAKRKNYSESAENWETILPSFSTPTTLHYRFFGETKQGTVVQTQEYSVDLRTWVKPCELKSTTVQGSEISFSFRFAALDHSVNLHFHVDNSARINLTTDTIELPDETKREKPSWHASAGPDGLNCWICDDFQIRFDAYHMTFTILKNDQPILTESRAFEILMKGEGIILSLRRFFKSPSDEVFLGLGERFNTLNQNGKTIDTRVFEQYRHQGSKTYFPIPFVLSSRRYALFIDSPRWSEFSFSTNGRKSLRVTQKTDPGLDSRLVLLTGNNLMDIVEAFTRSVGLPVLPPVWAFGLWMSSNDWDTQAEVFRQKDLMISHQIPATVLVIEAWSDEKNFYIWNDATYTPGNPGGRFTLKDFEFPEHGKWPDPQGMTEELHNAGLKLILWQIPVLKHLFPQDLEKYGPSEQHDLDEAHMIENDLCVHNPDGSPYRVPPMWFANSLVLDVTNPDALEWWLGKRQYLLDEIGVDGFKTDGGEHLWSEDLQFSDGRSNAELWNLYPKYYQEAYQNFANCHKTSQTIMFSRSGFTGSQSTPCHWAGDQMSTWEAFKSVLIAGQNLGLCGVPFWGWDIGGFSGEIPSAELYLRSTAAAAFAPVMQYHSEHNQHQTPCIDRTPWNMQNRTRDHRVIPIFRRFANLRMSILPYLYSEAHHSSLTGHPLFGCPYAKYLDPDLLNFPTQFLCGRRLLVAPVVAPNREEWTVYLPQGEWKYFWTGEVFSGGQNHTIQAPLDEIPVFVLLGTCLPMNLNPCKRFGAFLGNDLHAYQVLTILQYGENPDTSAYPWFDYITQKTYNLDNKDETLERLRPITESAQDIQWDTR